MITSFAPSCKTARQEQQPYNTPWGKNARTPTQHSYPIITYFSTGLCWHQSSPDLLAALLLNLKVQLNTFYSPTSGISSLLLPEFRFLFFLEFFHSGILHRDPYVILHLLPWNSLTLWQPLSSSLLIHIHLLMKLFTLKSSFPSPACPS